MTFVLLIVTITGALYLAVANLRVAAFLREPLMLAAEFLPSITILKPIAGLEPDLYENLASFCNQEYPEFDVIFCLHSNEDPALTVVERVIAEAPSRNAGIAIGHNPSIANPKIANLAKPGVDPSGEIVVIADSDIRVERNYLRALAASFAGERTGAATCLYTGMPNRSLASRLGALQIEDGFAPSVLVALALGKLRFCLGATMAVRHKVLEEVGGLAALGTQIADDHELGRLVAQHGDRIELSRYVVKTTIPETSLRELVRHELRWARINFALAPAGYCFSFVMYALPFAVLYLAVSRNLAWGLPLLAIILALRIGLHYLTRVALSAKDSGDLWLLPLRDILTLGIWLASFFTRTIYWRNEAHRM